MAGHRTTLKLAARALGRRPAFTAAAVLTLALGIGASTALFSVVHAVLLRPLPLPQPERLVRTFQAYPERDVRFGTLSRPDFDDWAARAESLDGLAVYSRLPGGPTLTGGERPRVLETAWVSGSFFGTLGLEAARGRTFNVREEAAGERLAVVSHDFWQRHFGGDTAAVGAEIELSGTPWVVCGVLPPTAATFPQGVEVWLPLGTIAESAIPRLREVRFLDAVGRLAPGATAQEAEEELTAIAATLAEEYPDSNAAARAATVVPLTEHMVGEVRPALLSLLGAVVLMLLVACSNVAALQLVRGLDRGRELAVRAALGAGRGRLLGETLAESLLLAAAGGTLGLGIATWGGELLVHRAGGLLPRPVSVEPNGALLLFAAATTLTCAVLVGLLPAWRASRTAPHRQLGGRSRGALDRRRGRLLPSLVVLELALATLLLIGAGLLVRSVGTLLATPPGFEGRGVLGVSLTLPGQSYPERHQYLDAQRRLLERTAALPGVESVATLRNMPLSGDPAEIHHFSVTGPPDAHAPDARMHMASPGLFRTLGIPLLEGRDLRAGDDAEAPPVAVINRRLARLAFPDGPAVGSRLWVGEAELTVVGVVGDVRHRSLATPPEPALYLSYRQVARRSFTLLLRGRDGVSPSLESVRKAVAAVDPDLALSRVAALDDMVAASAGRPRLFAGLLGLLAALAAALAAVGTYGVLSYVTGLRRHEIGVRLTLGARRGQIVRLLLGRGVRLGVLGVALGVAAALPAARLLRSLLYGVGPADPVAFGAAAALLLAAALWAVYLPARRGARLDPRRALENG